MIDLTNETALVSLGEVLQQFQRVAGEVVDRTLVAGAMARDLILHYTQGLTIQRATVDLDLAVAVRSWSTFQQLEARLIDAGARRNPHASHQFFMADWRVDIIPFGDVEHDGMIVWPRTGFEMTVAGFDEASEHALTVLLPGRVQAFVVSPPALLVLKLIAWKDRHVAEPHHDAVDIKSLIASYAGRWNEDRLYGEADDLLQRFGYDSERAAAALLGRDAGALARPATLTRIRAILDAETTDEAWRLARDMDTRVEDNLALLQALASGVQDAALSRR